MPLAAEGLELHQPLPAGPRETDAGKRADIIHQMQKLEYEQGGYIIPMFNNLVDAYSTKVAGFNQGSKATLNLDSFGHGYRNIWFA